MTAAEDLRGEERSVDLKRLVAAASLVSVDLVNVSARREYGTNDKAMLEFPVKMKIAVGVQVLIPVPLKGAGGGFVTQATATWKDEGNEELARVEAWYRLGYSFGGLEVEQIDQSVANAFGNELAMHHAWPFLRERIVSLSVQLRLPPVVLPLHRPSMGGPAGKLTLKYPKDDNR